MRIRFAIPARQLVRQADRWWRENRPLARDLFARELAQVREQLAAAPESGTPYVVRGAILVRRVLMPKTKYGVYYEVRREEGYVMIVSVWSGKRGRGPIL